jgi:hypothetical protein
MLRKLINNHKGTAEIIGSVMFLLIMMFFFTNVFLWHDRATREMDGVLSEKMNSLVSIQVVSMNISKVSPDMRLNVTNNGGVGVFLSRLWIITRAPGGWREEHTYKDFRQDSGSWLAAGSAIPLWLNPSDASFEADGTKVTFIILTTRGNMAACSCYPYD